MIRHDVIDMVKNGDVWVMPDNWQLPDLNKNPKGERMLLALPPPRETPMQIISLENPRKSGEKKDYIDFNRGPKLPPPREETADLRVRSWLITTTKLEAHGRDTAFSCALQDACIKKMQREGKKPWNIMAPIIRKISEKTDQEVRQIKGEIKSARIADMAAENLSRNTSWKVYRDGWYLKDDGSFVRTGMNIPEDGKLNKLHVGDYMSKKEQKKYNDYVHGEMHCYVHGEVHCG